MRVLPLLTTICWLLTPRLGAQTIRGSIVDQENLQPVAFGSVTLLDQFGNDVARVQVLGQFSLTAPAAGRYGLRFDAPGFQTTYTRQFDLAAPDTTTVTIGALRRAPVTLDTVQLSAEPVAPRLAEFHERRRTGLGTFQTRQEFEKLPTGRVTDVLRRMAGVSIVRNPRYLVGGDLRQFLVSNSRMGGPCPPTVFLDGMPISNAAAFDFDGVVPIQDLEAVESYSVSTVPARFAAGAGGCGVIALWTRPPVR